MNPSFDQAPKPEQIEDIVRHNLRIMGRPMHDLAESRGGNAGITTIDGKNCSCAIFNGYADKLTGKILIFTNDNPPQDILERSHPLMLKSALYFDAKLLVGGEKIIDFSGADQFPPQARKNIEDAIEQYNAENWKL